MRAKIEGAEWLHEALLLLRVLYWVFAFQFVYNTFEAFRHVIMDGPSERVGEHLWGALPAGLLILLTYRAFKAVAWGKLPTINVVPEEK